MNWLEAIILGLIQGLTEFLPVSSSGHLELAKVILGIEAKGSMIFTIVVHGATVLSTIVIFRKDLWQIIKGLLEFKWNQETQYFTKIIISMIPVGIVALFLKDQLEELFTGNVLLVGSMLLFTAALLAFTYFAKSKEKEVSFLDSIIIGIAQAIAVLPGVSRSGATIATGLILGNKKELIAKFSFLMVLIPILGENFLDIIKGETTNNQSISVIALAIGFVVAFITGLFACKWMISIVKKGKLIYFAIYCFVIGSSAIIYSLAF